MPCAGLLEAWRAREPWERVLMPSALVKDALRTLRWLPAAMLSSSSNTCSPTWCQPVVQQITKNELRESGLGRQMADGSRLSSK